MIIYKYDPYGAFVEAVNARVNPEDPDEVLVPRQATTITPPSAGPTEVPVFDEASQTWSVMEDNRGPCFDTVNSQQIMWVEPGPLPDSIANSLPPDAGYEWNSTTKQWELNSLAAKDAAIKEKELEIKAVALARIQSYFPQTLTFGELRAVYGLMSSFIDFSIDSKHSAVKGIYDYAYQKIEELDALDIDGVKAYNPNADASFPM